MLDELDLLREQVILKDEQALAMRSQLEQYVENSTNERDELKTTLLAAQQSE